MDKVASKVGDSKQIMVESLKSSWIIILIVAAMLILVLVVIYIISMVKKNKLQNVSMQDSMIDMTNLNVVPYKVPSADLSLVTNGQEFSYTFWIILSSNYDSTSDYKIVMQRGNTHTTVFSSNTNPIILLDKTVNSMYICISTTQVQEQMTPTQILAKNPQGQYTSGYLISKIDYIPLQRWVFIGIVIKDTTLYVFLDGDLYSATTIYNISSASGNRVRPIIKGTNGDLKIGEKVNTTKGYLSNSKFFNYGLTQKEMQSNYNQGPSKTSLLAMIGLKNYGVRSPIYEIKDS